MERFKRMVKDEDDVVIEHFASEIKRMRTGTSELHASSDALRASMKKRAEEMRGEATKGARARSAQAQTRLAQAQSSFMQYKKKLEDDGEKLKENTKRRIAHIWGSHKPGTAAVDIL